MSAKIYVVASPLGNREDLSPRARRILQEVDLIACEDTRRTGQLLRSLDITNSNLVSYYDAVEEKRAHDLIARVQREDVSLALVSDAGTPAIADPRFRLVRLAHENAIPVMAIPGPSTLAALVSVSGLPSDRVLFVGFLPRKKTQMLSEIKSWQKAQASVVAFESPNRLVSSLEILAEEIPHAEICIGRELTKIYEEVRSFPIPQALVWAREHTHLKGELAMMIHIPIPDDSVGDDEWSELLQKAQFLLSRGMSHKDLVEFFDNGRVDRKELYRRILEIKKPLS